MHQKYTSKDKVQTTNGSGMFISHVDHSKIITPSKDLLLKNVLHVPRTSKNLLSDHHLASDNNVFLEFHPNCFLIKDLQTKKTLFQGKCEGGLYPLHPSSTSTNKGLTAIRIYLLTSTA